MGPVAHKIKNILPNKNEDPEKRYFKTIVLLCIGIIFLMAAAGITAFVITIQSDELTMVPNLEGVDLENALISLEERALFASIQLRYSNDPGDKGMVVGQDPVPGTSVKANSRILLKVSKGSPIENLDDFTGWDLDDLEAHLRSMVNIYGPLLSIKRPVVSVYDESPTGTILEQKPEPGTQLSELTALDLVVSRGPFGQTHVVLDYGGMAYPEVITSVVKTNIPFMFTSSPKKRGDVGGTVVSQSPPVDEVVPVGTILQFEIAEPDEQESGDLVFGILERTLPEYEVPVRLIAEAVSPLGVVKPIFSMRHPGGIVTVPYLEPEDTQIRIIIGDQSPITYTVRADE
ncbi:MAG: PASTA domain-containing protein [Spirochaetales bacterium]|nr:PASTA domain-containing protein [Spirochaetales bacterium]